MEGRLHVHGGGFMSRQRLPSFALAILVWAGCVLVGCGGGGLNYWLYPEPYLAESEEALFLAYESHLVQAIDGQDTVLKCWGGPRTPQAYSRKDTVCRLHLQPGEHSIVFFPGMGSRERVSLTFTALPGKAYGLDRSACNTTYEGRQETCRVEIREIRDLSEGG